MIHTKRISFIQYHIEQFEIGHTERKNIISNFSYLSQEKRFLLKQRSERTLFFPKVVMVISFQSDLKI